MDAPNSYKDPYWATIAANAERKQGLPGGLLTAIFTHGEKTNNDQVSGAGAKTPFQIIPETRNAFLKKYGIDAYLSPENAAEVGALHVKESLDRNGGDPAAAVSEYHAGPNRKNWGPITKAYTERVMAKYQPNSEQNMPEAQQTIAQAATNKVAKQSTFDRIMAEQQAGPTGGGAGDITNVYNAYKAGKMPPEDAAAFESEVNGGRMMLPRGGALNTPTGGAAAPQGGAQGAAGTVIPPAMAQAYQSGAMDGQDRIEFEALVKNGTFKLPDGVQLGQVAPKPGIMERIAGIPGAVKEAFTGAQRTTPEVASAVANNQTLYDMPETNTMSMGLVKSALGGFFANSKERADILAANLPGVTLRQDNQGNHWLKSPKDGKEYVIPPGMQWGDVPRAVGTIAAFTPAARAATIPGMAVGAMATQFGIEGTQAATGGSFDPKEVAIAGALGAGVPVVLQGAGAALNAGKNAAGRVLNKAATGMPDMPMAGVIPQADAAAAALPVAERSVGQGTPLPPIAPIAPTTVKAAPIVQQDFEKIAQANYEKYGGKGVVDESTNINAKSNAFADIAEAEGWSVSDRGAKYFTVSKSLGKDAEGYPIDLNVKVRVSDHSNVNRGVHFDEHDINIAPDDGYFRHTFDEAIKKLKTASVDSDGNTVFNIANTPVAQQNIAQSAIKPVAPIIEPVVVPAAAPAPVAGPQPPVIAPYAQVAGSPEAIEAATRTAAQGGFGSKKATQSLAEMVAPDAQTVAAAERLGMLGDLQPGHITTNGAFRQMDQLVKSQTGSPTLQAQREGLLKVVEKANGYIEAMGGAVDGDVSTLSAKVLAEGQASIKQVKASAGKMFDKVDAAIPAATPIDAATTVGMIRARAANIGGEANLSGAEKQILGKLSGEGIQPVYGLINDIRTQLNAAKYGKAQEAFQGIDDKLRDNLINALRADQGAAAKAAGVGAEFETAQALSRTYKGTQEDMKVIFGKALDKSLSKMLKNSVKALSGGDDAGFIKLIQATPPEMRGEVVATGLQQFFQASARGGEMNFGAYAQWFEKLVTQKKAYTALMANLPKGAPQQLLDLARVSRGVAMSKGEFIATGKAINPKALEAAEGFTNKVFDMVKERGMAGLMAEVIGTTSGAPGMASALTSAVTKNKPTIMQSADALISSPEFMRAVTATTVQQGQAVKAVASSPTFTKFYKAAGSPKAMSNREQWIVNAMQSANNKKAKK
jgi:hypothetical protein